MTRGRELFDAPVPSSGILLQEVDGLRAVASLNVVVCHAMLGSHWTPDWVIPLINGGVGVELFFVISGFLLCLPFLRAQARGERVAMGPYASRRMLRILPAYYVNLAIFVLFLWPEGLTTWRGVYTVFAHLTLTFGVSETMVKAISPVYWTLGVEEQFYLALPFVARLFTRNAGVVLLALSALLPNVLSLAYQRALGVPGVALLASLPYHWTAFVLGMLVALLFHRYGTPATGAHSLPPALRSALWVLTPLGLFVTYSARRLSAQEPFFVQFWGLGWALVLASVVLGPRWVGTPLRWKPMRILGLMTFSIYLWHIAVAERVFALSDPPSSPLTALARIATVFLFTLPFAAGSYVLVERPFMDLRRRLETRRKTSLGADGNAPAPAST